jgi:uncharacterized membrane protein YbhN (UPF0104 family)
MSRKQLSAVLTLGTFVALGAYIWWHWLDFAPVVVVSPLYLMLCALSTVGAFASSGMLLYAMVNKLGTRIGIWECLNLSVAVTGLNVLLPLQGGMVVRAVYLKRHHDFAYSRFLAMLIACQVLLGVVCSSLAAATLGWLMLRDDRRSLGLMVGCVTVCLGVSLLACFFPPIRAGGNWFWDRVAVVSDSWCKLRAEPRLLVTLAALVGLQVGGGVLSFWTGFGALGVRVGLLEATAAATLATLLSILSLTPGGIGIYEAAAAFVGAALAIAPINSVMASVVSRVVQLALLLILTPLAVFFLHRSTSARPIVPH